MDTTTTSRPGSLPGPVGDAWQRLARPTGDPATFDPAAVDGLPAPVGRWLTHVITPGTPLRRTLLLAMHGEIRIGSWRPFTARQVIGPDGFVWAAETGGLLRVRGFDRYTDGEGEMRWRLLGLVPVMSATGPDITRSAAGRHAAEALTLVPAAALAPEVVWRGLDEHRATGAVTHRGFDHEITIEVDDEGVLRSVALPRWGNPDKGPHREHVFGVLLDGERDVGGQRLPAGLRAGWWLGSDRWDEGEFFRCSIDAAELV